MKRIVSFVIFAVALILPSSLSAQVVDTTVCAVLTSPQSFDGKIVRLKGDVIVGFDEFVVRGKGCNRPVSGIWLSYPAGTNAKAGPVAVLLLRLAKNSSASIASPNRAPVTLDKDKNFKEFDRLLSTPAKAQGICLGCVKYEVTATLVGRLDGTKAAGLIRDGKGRVIGIGGFGNLNRYRARLVLQSVSDLVPHEIDYARRGGAASMGEASATESYLSAEPAADQVERAVKAFGAPGEDNGVNVGFGGANEVPKNDSPKADANSPDGLIFDVILDGERLKGTAMNVALAHVGTHIADIRSTKTEISTLPLYAAEFRAWQTSVLSAAGAKVRALTAPGGTVLYSRAWPTSDLWKDANGGISQFLTNWAGVANPPMP